MGVAGSPPSKIWDKDGPRPSPTELTREGVMRGGQMPMGTEACVLDGDQGQGSKNILRGLLSP